jgi:hypothetical protein
MQRDRLEGDLTFPRTFRISPLIRLTLGSLYLALTLPLPFLARATEAPVPASGLGLGIAVGAIALYAAFSDRVTVTEEAIEVSYPAWVPRLFRKGWRLRWDEVADLKARTTGQGGLVYYFLSQSGQRYLLPMRVAGFAQLARAVEAKTGIDTADVKPLSQPWMYFILLGLTVLLLLVDAWPIATAIASEPIL